jgi:ATP/maltotriose-dependent transcriptional regulator MalT
LPVAAEDVLDGLAVLVDHSLVVAEERDAELRYRLLETVREYGQERLVQAGEDGRIRERHAATFLALVEAIDAGRGNLPWQSWPLRLLPEHDNLRAALTWCRETGRGAWQLRLAAALNEFWYASGHATEGRGWLEDALARCTEAEAAADAKAAAMRPVALCGLGALARSQGDLAAARAWLEEALTLAEVRRDDGTIAWACYYLGLVRLYTGDAAGARTSLARCVALARATAQRWLLAVGLWTLGDATLEAGDLAAARALYEESLTLSRTADLSAISTYVLPSLSRLALETGDVAEACALAEEALAIRRRPGYAGGWDLEIAIATLAEALRCGGQWERAAALAAESLALSRAVADKPTAAWALQQLGDAARARGDAATAAAHIAESVRLARAIGQPRRLAAGLAGLAELATAGDDPSRGARLLGAAAALLDAHGARLDPADRPASARAAAAARRALGDAAFDRAVAAGRALVPEAVIAEALAVTPRPRAAVSGPPGGAPRAAGTPSALTAREVEVLRLLAAGRSNKEIAATLVISLNTVERHIKHIFEKTGASNRTEAAAYAHRSGLLP